MGDANDEDRATPRSSPSQSHLAAQKSLRSSFPSESSELLTQHASNGNWLQVTLTRRRARNRQAPILVALVVVHDHICAPVFVHVTLLESFVLLLHLHRDRRIAGEDRPGTNHPRCSLDRVARNASIHRKYIVIWMVLLDVAAGRPARNARPGPFVTAHFRSADLRDSSRGWRANALPA